LHKFSLLLCYCVPFIANQTFAGNSSKTTIIGKTGNEGREIRSPALNFHKNCLFATSKTRSLDVASLKVLLHATTSTP
jgi:hypothetical protein